MLGMLFANKSPTDFGPFLSAIRACIGVTTVISVPALFFGNGHILDRFWNTFEISGWRELPAVDDVTWDLTCGAYEELANWDSSYLQKYICETFATSHLRKLWVYDDGWNIIHGKELALRAPGIDAISCTASAGAELCRTLCEDCEGGPCVSPRLTALFLEIHMFETMPEFIDDLLDVLAARDKAGYGPTQLTMDAPMPGY
ncbi:hypothetical protein FA95DRAFT_1663060 [Auriscalpium vulgare]|uniref:Uncharacterized protein n=1 Tax=Auriscalpium vulgare TaxID=40419 RepID=A0ACB8RTS9_9AGAM|nr:hypothetical protein FA95DRAFT_1663060 [Auriscalpium vulgare]